ncbi:prefoldin subunit 6 [[Candida] jaroonii]|uniref:Prefoldin subunit 6 n=1 Tax=[Candida] jaroonii TaxID=467808 RepID=A0ACA9Y1Q6_9ASCO|nr:prefoldin subunit 6 [[Candida] jaroonii]
MNQEFEKASLSFSKAQNELNDLISTRQQLETQYQENKIVLDEFSYLNEDSKIFKLTGPVLLPQDYSEAKINVEKRIEFIQEEIKRAETKIQGQQKIIEESRNTLMDIRQKMSN